MHSHRTCDVYEKQEGNFTLRAQLDKMRRLESRRREQYAIVSDNADIVAVDVCKSLFLPVRVGAGKKVVTNVQ